MTTREQLPERRWATSWRDLRRRTLAEVCTKVSFVVLMLLGLSLDQNWLGWPASVLALAWMGIHGWLRAFRCPFCGKPFASLGFWGFNPAMIIPPYRCLHCGVRKGAKPDDPPPEPW